MLRYIFQGSNTYEIMISKTYLENLYMFPILICMCTNNFEPFQYII